MMMMMIKVFFLSRLRSSAGQSNALRAQGAFILCLQY